jgi:hypothetical protein
MPERPKFVKDLVTKFTKANVPHFFKYAKDKDEWQVSEINNSFVNKLNNIIPNPRINCRSIGLGTVDYKLLMSNPDIECKVVFTDRGKLIKEKTDPLIVKYCELNSKYHFSLDNALKVDRTFSTEVLMNSQVRQDLKYKRISDEIKYELSQCGYTDNEIADILVKFLYGIKASKHKVALWLCYGDYILSNLEKHFKPQTKPIQCVDCGKWFEVGNKDNKTCRCYDCVNEHKRELIRLRVKKYREK